jgi:DNA-binding protein HU-beta
LRATAAGITFRTVEAARAPTIFKVSRAQSDRLALPILAVFFRSPGRRASGVTSESTPRECRCCLQSRQIAARDSPVFLRFPERIACICALSGKLSARSTANAPLIRCRERIGQMTKNELIAAVADKAQMTKTAAASAVDATFDAITSTLKRGGEVKIMGFGNFRVVKRAAREGRDPRTGAPVKIKAARRPRFSAGKGLKEAVNK